MPETLVQETVRQLREASKGRFLWRVQDKTTKAYCMEFSDFEKWEAEAWWKENSTKFPDYHKNNELARVHFRSHTEKLMIKAAKLLEEMELQQ